MANQVLMPLETQLPSEPEIGQLSQMQVPIVMVQRVTRGEKGREQTQLVINGQTGLSWQEILKLQDVLPTGQVYPNSGPGIYRFSVTDGESAAKCSWQTRLGGAGGEAAVQPAPVAASPFTTGSPVASVRPVPATFAPSPGVRQIGNGFSYDPELELLTLPDGTAHPWRRGQPLPAAATTPLAAPIAAPATPVSHFAGPGMPFFAQPSPELEATKQALAETQRALEAMRRQQDDERRETTRQQEMAELRTTINKLAEQLTARPREDPTVAELKHRLERQEELATLRAESKAQIDAIMTLVREQGAGNRGLDPVITVLTSMMQQGNQAAAETLRIMRETAGAERQTFMTMLDRQAAMAEKAAANNPLEKVGSLVDMMVDRVGRVMQMEREFAGSSSGTDWMGVIKELAGRAGSAVEMYQQAEANKAAAATAQANAQIATARVRAAQLRALPAGQAPAAAKPAQVAPVKPAQAAAPAAPPPTPAAPATRPTRVRVPTPDLEKATLAELRSVFNVERDEVFFGDVFPHVKQLREAVAMPGVLSARKIAELLMEARDQIVEAVQQGHAAPHAVEIWAHGQVAYLVERLLPEASEGLRSEVIKELMKLQAEEDDAERIEANTGGENE